MSFVDVVRDLPFQLHSGMQFLAEKMHVFPRLTRGEQVAYVAILLGIVCLITAALLFII